MYNETNDGVDARKLHARLGSKKDFSNWIKEKIIQADLQILKDFTTSKAKSPMGRPSIEYELTIEAAKELCLLQQTPAGHTLRRELIELSNKVESGKLFGTKKAAIINNYIRTFSVMQYQLEAEDIHLKSFKLTYHGQENIHKAFSEYRGNTLSINNAELKRDLVVAFNNGQTHKTTAKNIRARIFYLDKYKLIRDAIADYLIGIGAPVKDAINFADTVKEVAEYMGIEIRIKDENNLFQIQEGVIPPNLLGIKNNPLLLT